MGFSPIYVYKRNLALIEYFRKPETEARVKKLIPKFGTEAAARLFIRETFIKEYDKRVGGVSPAPSVVSAVTLGGMVGKVPAASTGNITGVLGKKQAVQPKKPVNKVDNKKKEAVKSGLFGSSAEGTQANTNVILSGKSSPEVTIAALERAATDLEAGIAGATMADKLNLAITYEQFGKIQAHVSSDGHISLKEIEDTIRLFNPKLSDALVAHCAALIAKEMNIGSGGLYPIETRGASPAAVAEIPKSMKKMNIAKLALVPLVGLALYYFFFKKR